VSYGVDRPTDDAALEVTRLTCPAYLAGTTVGGAGGVTGVLDDAPAPDMAGVGVCIDGLLGGGASAAHAAQATTIARDDQSR
jgi:hypothetical protein